MPERPMICPKCGATMNHHGEKLVYGGEGRPPGIDPLLGGSVEEFHACPGCGYVASRPAG
jgi:hypothetical protein